MKESLVSIIVPVYNVGPYLKRCIDSVLNQSYLNLELILIDDGSTDESPVVCDDYANKDSRVHVFHKENSGSSDARNMGLDNTKGEYVLFVDADDYISSDMLDTMIKLMSGQTDVVVCDFASVTNDTGVQKLTRHEEPHTRIVSSVVALEDMMYQRFITNSPWAKLYKAGLFEGVRFPSGKINQDLGTTYKVLAKADMVSLIDKKMYMYMYRPNSVINSKFSMKRMAGLQFAIEQCDFIRSNFPDIEKAAVNRLFTEGAFILQKMDVRGVISCREAYRKCKVVVKRTRMVVLRDQNSLQKYRVFALISCIHPLLLVLSGSAARLAKRLKRTIERLRK